MREVPGNQAARQVPARPESEGRPQPSVPRLPRQWRTRISATSRRAVERRPPSRAHSRTDVPDLRPTFHADPEGPELLPAVVQSKYMTRVEARG